MEIIYRKKFKKQFSKQSKNIQNKFFERIELLIKDELNLTLNNHELNGEFKGIRSFNATGDIRVHFIKSESIYIILRIGSHTDLYK